MDDENVNKIIAKDMDWLSSDIMVLYVCGINAIAIPIEPHIPILLMRWFINK